MLVSLSSIHDLLRHPGNPENPVSLQWEGNNLVSAKSGDDEFLVSAGQPILIDFAKSLCRTEFFAAAEINVSVIGKRSNVGRMIKGAMTGSRRVSRGNVEQLKALLPSNPLVLMVGAGTQGAGCELLYEDQQVRQIAFDIYPSTLTQFVADAHQIPLPDASLDGVVVQAVLEHVLDPATVVSEIYRVLRPGGIVYAETPFMQQVHEGAYDFTRFTELGHRWLWREFEEIRRGVIGGPGLSLYWSSRYFWRALLRNQLVADVVSFPYLFFALFDNFLPMDRKIEGANGVSFLGRKGVSLSQEQLISCYLGPKH